MGNFLTDDAGGMLLGSLAAPFVQDWYNNYFERDRNKQYNKATDAVQNLLYGNHVERTTKQILDETGMSQYLNQDPKAFVQKSKEGYAAAQSAGDEAAMKKYNQQANTMRGLAQQAGIDMSGYGAGDTLASIAGRKSQSSQLGSGLSLVPNSNNLTSGLNLAQKIGIGTVPQEVSGLMGNNRLPPLALSEDDRKQNITEEILMQTPAYREAMQADMQRQQAERQKRADAMMNAPDFMSQINNIMRKNMVNESIRREIMGEFGNIQAQHAQQNAIKQYTDAIKIGDVPAAYKASLEMQMFSPTMAKSMYVGAPTPKNVWDFDRGTDRLIQQYDLDQAGAEANLERTKNLGGFNAETQRRNAAFDSGLQKDLLVTQANSQRQLANSSREDQINFWRALGLKDSEIVGLFTGASKSAKMPDYSKDIDKSFGLALQTLENGDTEGAKKYIDEMELMLNRTDIDDEDRENIRLLMYIANAKRELVAGNTVMFNKYVSAIPKKHIEQFGLYYGGNKAQLRAPR